MQAAECLNKVGSEDARRMLMELVKDSEWYVRFRALDSLLEMGWVPPLNVISRGLDSTNETEVQHAVQALVTIGITRTKHLLLQRLTKSYRWVSYIIDAVAKNQVTEAAGALSKLAVKGKESYHRYNALEALVEIDPRAAQSLLISAAEKDKDYNVREKALRSLVQVDPASALPVLARAAERDSSWLVRDEAVRLLADLGTNAAILDLWKIARCRDGSEKRDVLNLLAKHDSGTVMSQASALLKEDWGVNVVLYAIECGGSNLEKHQVASMIEIASRALRNKHYGDRVRAARALGSLPGNAAETLLIEALEDRDEDIRIAAKRALEKIGTDKTIKRLKKERDKSIPYLGIYISAITETIQHRSSGEDG